MKPNKNYRARNSLGQKTQFEFARAKKSLGQNFLKSEMALRKIIEAGEIKLDDIILEIGPGRGVLTAKLLEKAGTVIAIEKDRELFQFLQKKFAEQIKSGSLVLIHGDILEFDMSKTVFDTRNYKIIANIPYNITGAILKKFLTAKNQPESMILMIQHEVAQRIIARNAKESILSISVKAYGEPKIIVKVPKRYFSPAPKVDSAIIAIKNISRQFFKNNELDEETFWEIVKTGFAHKRKKLSGNLKSLKTPSQGLSLRSLDVVGNKRAEDLTLSDWLALAK